MTRAALFAVLLTTAAGLARAEVPEAPPPRPAGVKPRQPVPKSADPAATVEKIISNTKATADRLAKSDTGADTRKLQDETLALIDSLLDQSGNPPPRPDQNPEPKPDQKKDSDQKSDPKQQDTNTGENPQEKEKNADPKSGKQDGKREKKPGDGGKGGKKEPGPKGEPEKGGQPMTGAGGPKGMETESGAKTEPGPKQEPMPGSGQPKKDGKGPKDDPKAGMAGGVAGGKPPLGKVPPRPSLAIDEEVAKQFWGHLREKERQQAMQWFHERSMPKYEDLTNLYFSSLGDRRPVAEQRK